jgi:mono/diheme cytochrome c family protein
MKAKFFLVALVIVFGVSSVITMTSSTLPQAKPWKTPANYASMKAPKSTPESVKAGMDIYVKQCKSCHGAKGLGDGPKSATLKSTITAFNDKAFKALGDGDKYYRAFVGRDEMPNFEKKITSETDRWAVIHYINTL